MFQVLLVALHCSHNYRIPEAFKGQTVVVVGAANSGVCRLADTILYSPTCHAQQSLHIPNCAAHVHDTEVMLNHVTFPVASPLVLQVQLHPCQVLEGCPHCTTSPTQPVFVLMLLFTLSACAGEDICRELSAVAEQVIISARSWRDPGAASDPRPFGPHNNISKRGMVSALHPDGRVEFTQVGVKPPSK